MHGGWHGAGVERIAYSERWLQGSVRNARLGFRGREVEDRTAGRLGAGTGGRWNGDEWEEGFADWKTFAERRVDEVEEVGLRVAEVEVHQFGGVDYGAAADGEEGVWCVGGGEGDSFLDAAFRQNRTDMSDQGETYEVSFGSTLVPS